MLGLPLKLVRNLVDCCDGLEAKKIEEAKWTFDDEKCELKSDDGMCVALPDAVMDRMKVLWSVWEFMQDDVLDVELALLHFIAHKSLSKYVTASLLLAVNYASDMSLEWWRMCGLLLKEDAEFMSVVDEDVGEAVQSEDVELWRVMKAFPCMWVFERVLRKKDVAYVRDNIHLLEWESTDVYLWIDVYMRSILSTNLKTFELREQLVLDVVPKELRLHKYAIKSMIMFERIGLLEDMLNDLESVPSEAIATMVKYLLDCDDNDNKLALLKLTLKFIDDAEVWYNLLSKVKCNRLKRADLQQNRFRMYETPIPLDFFAALCSTPDEHCHVLRQVFMCNELRFLDGISFNVTVAEQDVKQNMLAVSSRLYESALKGLIRHLMTKRYFDIVKTLALTKPATFPMLQIASETDALTMVACHNNGVFNYDCDSTPNSHLSNLFFGRLCRASERGVCAQILARYFLRMYEKTAIQVYQDDCFELKFGCCREHSLKHCCMLCRNVYQAAKVKNMDALRDFLNRPA